MRGEKVKAGAIDGPFGDKRGGGKWDDVWRGRWKQASVFFKAQEHIQECGRKVVGREGGSSERGSKKSLQVEEIGSGGQRETSVSGSRMKEERVEKGGRK